MKELALIAKAQELVRLLEDPERLQSLGQSFATVAGLLERQTELAAELVRLEDQTRRHEAESASRVLKCNQHEAAAQQRFTEAEEARHRELITLDQARTAIKTELAALYEERGRVRQEVQQARDEQADVLRGLAREQAAAAQALEASRAALTRLREAIPT